MGSLNRVPALIGCGKSGNVTSVGWQVTLCDPIWHFIAVTCLLTPIVARILYFTCVVCMKSIRKIVGT